VPVQDGVGDVSPTSGTLLGGGPSTVQMAVDVEHMDEARAIASS